jgi:hypothetical protein
MNAIQQPFKPPVPPPEKRRTPHKRHARRQRLTQVVALETTAKLAVNIVICGGAISALIQLLPYNWMQQDKLREINTEVSLSEGRVNHLQTDFSRYFDPHQAKNIMQEQSQRVDPNQRQVYMIDKDASESEDRERSH